MKKLLLLTLLCFYFFLLSCAHQTVRTITESNNPVWTLQLEREIEDSVLCLATLFDDLKFGFGLINTTYKHAISRKTKEGRFVLSSLEIFGESRPLAVFEFKKEFVALRVQDSNAVSIFKKGWRNHPGNKKFLNVVLEDSKDCVK